MEPVIIFLAVIFVAFVGAYLSSRRFGVLALSLATGSVLSGLWAVPFADWLTHMGISLTWLPNGVIASIVLLLLPLFILLTSGPKYFGKYERIAGALMIGVLAAAFLVQPLGRFLVLEGDALAVYRWLAGVWQYIVTIGLVAGVFDLFLFHNSKASKADKKR